MASRGTTCVKKRMGMRDVTAVRAVRAVSSVGLLPLILC